MALNLLKSYGAQLCTFSYIDADQVQTMQHLNRWNYETGLPRCQVSIRIEEGLICFAYGNTLTLYDCMDRSIRTIKSE